MIEFEPELFSQKVMSLLLLISTAITACPAYCVVTKGEVVYYQDSWGDSWEHFESVESSPMAKNNGLINN